MYYGINLFGALRDRRDTLAALRELCALGFSHIEPCLAPTVIGGWEHVIWPVGWLEENLPEIRAMGLKLVSAHLIGWDIPAETEPLKKLAAETGIRQMVVKCPETLDERALHETALRYIQLSDALCEVGAELLLHNERPDIETRIRGRSAYEHLLELCLGKVGAQVDVGWALAGGEDPETLLWRLGTLVRSIHYKDLTINGGEALPADLGAGDLDVTACLQYARANGLPQILDQDEFAESCERSLRAGLTALARRTQEREPSASYLNVLDVDTCEIRTLARFERVVEAPNWMKTRDSLIYNSEGHIYRFDLDTSAETLIDTGSCDNCNNDHVLSPDEKMLAVSHGPRENGFLSRVYTLPITGGEPTLVTPNAPSFLHGWSPDGKELAYCAFREREGKWEVDVYAIPTEGGEEVRLTDGGFNDGPEYSPDGTHIWFNSTRSGLMQVWRMDRDGGHPTQMSTCERNNWFGHVSPDGKRVAYLSYAKGELEPNEHLPNMRVELRIMDADGANDRRLVNFFGGQGSMNVNSWAADSRHLAFVSYEILHK